MPINLRGSAIITDGSITTAKLADGAVTVAKVTTDIATQHFLGSEVSLPATGNVEVSVADFNFITGTTSGDTWKKFNYSIKLASSVGTNTASAKMYIDNVQFGTTQSTVSTTPVVFTEADIDISSLTAGSHHFEARLINSGSSDTATLSQIDVYLGKK